MPTTGKSVESSTYMSSSSPTSTNSSAQTPSNIATSTSANVAAILKNSSSANNLNSASTTVNANRPLNDLEHQQIGDLRKMVPKLANVDDAYILRWLRSKEGRFDETADGLKKNMVFRKAWDLDRIERWTAPEILEKYCGYGFLLDRECNPILMSLLGNMDVEGMLRSVQSKDYIKFSLAAIEKGIQLCKERALQTNRPFEQMMLVFDLDHITSAHYSSKQFASSFTTLVLLFQEHYPLVLRKILIIRAPEMARIAFNSMTPFLSSAIQALIEMPTEEGWQLALSQYVDLNAWPMHWGGRMCDDNGDPKCPSKIRYGLGPVPDSYYVDHENAMPDYDQLTTVYAGDKHLIELKVKANTRISWQYMTEEEDVGFAIYYDKTNQANNLTEMENVYPYIRLECSQVPVSGSLVCELSGRYIIEFDNYYSWFSAKQLRYNIEIDELCGNGNSANGTPTSITGGGGIPPMLLASNNNNSSNNTSSNKSTPTSPSKEMPTVKQQ